MLHNLFSAMLVVMFLPHINSYENKDHVGVTSIKIIKEFKLDSDTKPSLQERFIT